MAVTTLRLALGQMDSGPDKEANLRQASDLIGQAGSQGVELLALPECVDQIGGTLEPEKLDGPMVRRFCQTAAKNKLWLLVGSISEDSGCERPYNTSLLIDDQGQLRAAYRKIHLYDVTLADGTVSAESSRRTPGFERTCAATPWGKLGMAICYDLRFGELFGALARDGATLFSLPANFTAHTGKAHWEVLVRARAIENGAFVLAPGQVGQKASFKAWGHSLIVDPWGQILAQGDGTSVGLVNATLDLSAVTRARAQLPLQLHRRPQCYG